MQCGVETEDSDLGQGTGLVSGSRQTAVTLSHTYGIVLFVADAAFTSDIQASGTGLSQQCVCIL